MDSREIVFSVKIMYSVDDDDTRICPDSMAENLQAAIENERQNNTLTPEDISADFVTTQVEYSGKIV